MQIDIAKRVFSPDPADVAHAPPVIEAMGDGTGAIMLNGKMEDDASRQAVPGDGRAGRARSPSATPSWPRRYGFAEADCVTRAAPAPPVGPLHARRQRAGAGEGQDASPADALILDLEDAVAPDAKAAARGSRCARPLRPAATAGARSRSGSTALDTPWHADDLAAARAAGPGRDRRAQGQLGRRGPPLVEAIVEAAARPSTPRSGRWSRRRVAMLRRRGDRASRPSGSPCW